ncbi:MAG TPA: TlpA disulfide reductase family protein [Balneolaceae bacterium]|nr:TlpA disulfide reductase family protein [Balneolaceae bacterium]
MKFKTFILSICTIAAILFSGCSQESSNQQGASSGSAGVPGQDLSEQSEIIENATFTDLDGNPVTLDQFEGKLVLIDFWESWCGPCLQVFPAMADLREEYPDNFEVLAVTVGLTEGPEEAKAFAAENGYPFTWLYDENGVFDQLGASGIPYKVFISPSGELLEIEMGSRGREGDYNKTEAKIKEYL